MELCKLVLLRNLQDWEIKEVVKLFFRLEGQVINVWEADKLSGAVTR